MRYLYDFNSINAPHLYPNHSRAGGQPRRADDERPGAPDKACGNCPHAHVFSPTGAPAPDPKRLAESEAVAAYILQNARAC